MIDHLSYAVSDLPRSRAFYDAALAPLGYKRMMELDGMVGYGGERGPQLWLSAAASVSDAEAVGSSPGFHLAFKAADRTAVDRFYQAALSAGGRDNGAPGPRPDYHANYYAAFVLDPDGIRLEAVCHRPQS